MKEMTCIICPKGCTLTVKRDGASLAVSGNLCPRGKQYAVEECTHPTRTLTTLIRVENRPDTMVSVKSAVPIPKEKLFSAMERIRAARVRAPIAIGDVLLQNVCGADLIATKNIP